MVTIMPYWYLTYFDIKHCLLLKSFYHFPPLIKLANNELLKHASFQMACSNKELLFFIDLVKLNPNTRVTYNYGNKIS